MMRHIACLLSLSMAVSPAGAVAKPVDRCAHAPLPAEPWTSWRQSGHAIAGGEPASAPRLTLGKPLVGALRPSAQVLFAVRSTVQPRSQGGLFTLAVKTPARVGIALSAPADLQIVIGRSAISAIGVEEGPDCSGILSIHWFDLPQGVHLVQISGAKARFIRIMAADAAANRP